MARIRSIKIDLFVDDALADVSLAAHLLLAGLPVLADSAGRLEDRPRRIQAQLFPYREGVDVGACLDELAAVGALVRYEAAGRRYIQVANWRRDQRPHVKEATSAIPPPTDSTEHRQGVELAGNSPGTRRGKNAGILGVGSGVLDSGLGTSPPASQAAFPGVAGPPSKPAKTRKAKAEGKPSDPRHAPLVKVLVEEVGFPFDGGKDAANVAALLALADQQPATAGPAAPGEVVRRARLAWSQFPGFYSARTLALLRSRWGDFQAPAAPGRGPAPPSDFSTPTQVPHFQWLDADFGKDKAS